VWVTARFDVLFKSPNVTKTINIFLAHFRFFLKAPNLFNSTGHHACTPTPTKISIDILLPAAKTFGLKLAQPTSQNDFNLFLLLAGGGCTVLSISACWSLSTNPHRVVKVPHFEAWTRPEPEITSLNPARVRHLFLKPDLGLKANQGSYDMRNCRATKNVVCRYTLYHTQNNNHLDQNIGTIWHKRSMLVDDNTAEYNVSQEKKKLSRNYLRWRYGHQRNFLGQLYRYEKPACRLLKTSQESREWLISLRQSHRVLISSLLSPSQKECETNPSREEKKASVFSNRISWRKSQSLHSQKLPRWAQQICITKEKNPYS